MRVRHRGIYFADRIEKLSARWTDGEERLQISLRCSATKGVLGWVLEVDDGTWRAVIANPRRILVAPDEDTAVTMIRLGG